MSNECKAVPVNCRQRLAAEGKPYPRSGCASCGQMSPNWRECDSMLSRPVPEPAVLGDDLDDAMRDMASSACQIALNNGINEDAFLRLARSVRQRIEEIKPPALRGELGALLDQLDDYVARINGDDRGSDRTVNELRAHLAPLQAELERLKNYVREVTTYRDNAIKKIERLRNELTGTEKERDQLKAQCDEQAKALHTLISVARTVNRNDASEIRVPGDDEPQYRQRKEWIEYLLETCAEAEALSRPAGVEQV